MQGSKAMAASVDVVASIKQEFLEALPGITLGLSVLIIGVAAAYVLRWVFCSFLLKASKWLPKRLAQSSFFENYFNPMVNGIGKIVFFAVILVSLATSLQKMGLNVASGWLSGLVQYLPNAVAAVVIVFFGWRLKELLEDLLASALGRSKVAHAHLLAKSIGWTVFVLSALMALSQVGIDLNFLIVLIAVLLGALFLSLSLMLALGAKDVLTNVFHCHQVSKVFKAGDTIKLGAIEGSVLSIGPSYVVIDTKDGKVALAGKSFSSNDAIFVKQG